MDDDQNITWEEAQITVGEETLTILFPVEENE